MAIRSKSQVTILPKQFRCLAELSESLGYALGVSQDGSILHVTTAVTTIAIDADGHILGQIKPSQESRNPQ